MKTITKKFKCGTIAKIRADKGVQLISVDLSAQFGLLSAPQGTESLVRLNRVYILINVNNLKAIENLVKRVRKVVECK